MPTISESSDKTNLSRTQIIHATTRCFGHKGYDGVTIRSIARSLGCAVGSIYRYFEDKRALLSATAQDQLEPVAEMIEAGGSFEDSLRSYINRGEASPQLYHLMFWLCTIGTDAGVARRAPSTTGATSETEMLPSVVRRIITGWGQRLGDASLARQCWATVHGHLTLAAPPEAIVNMTLDMLGHTGDASRRAGTSSLPATATFNHVAMSTAQRGDIPATDASSPDRTHPNTIMPGQPSTVDDVCLL